MKFRKRMKPIIKKIGERTYEAVDWYHSKESAEKKAEEYKGQSFFSEAVYEPKWAGWFVYVSANPISKADVSRWTGLTGVEVDSIVRFLKEKDVDWQQVPDWKTIGEDVADFADKYSAVWDKLIEHGVVIERPLPVSEIHRKEELWKEEEEEWLLSTREGVKELLRRVYKNGLTKKEKDRLKEKLLNRPEFATLIALYNGVEQEHAKRFLAEMVIAPTRKDVKELLIR